MCQGAASHLHIAVKEQKYNVIYLFKTGAFFKVSSTCFKREIVENIGSMKPASYLTYNISRALFF